MRGRLKKFLSGGNISKSALSLIRYSLILSCALLVLSLLLTVWAGPLTARNIYIHRLAADLYRAPQGVLLAAFVGALIIDTAIKEGR